MRSVIYSADSQFVSAFQNACLGFDLQEQTAKTPAELMHLCTAQTLDLIIIDVDSAESGFQMIPLVKRESANREIVIFAAGTSKSPEAMIASGASLAMKKPVSIELARRHLRDALLITDGERRQFNRVPASGAMQMHSVSDGKIDGQLVNIGEGGLALKLSRVPKERAIVEVVFRLPGDPVEIHAPGKISWADAIGNVGVRFGALDPKSRYRLADWIANAEKPARPS